MRLGEGVLGMGEEGAMDGQGGREEGSPPRSMARPKSANLTSRRLVARSRLIEVLSRSSRRRRMLSSLRRKGGREKKRRVEEGGGRW